MPQVTDKITVLVIKAQSGDRFALEKLADRFYGEIFRLIFYRLGNRMDAEDIAQDTMTEMVKSINKLKEPAKFKPWLFRIGLNRWRDFNRKAKVRSILKPAATLIEKGIDSESNSALDHVLHKEFWQHFRHYQNRLSPMEKEIFTLRYVDQLKINEIADTLHKNESTIKTHLYRALHKFKQATGLRLLLKGEQG